VASVELLDVHKQFGETPVVRGVSLAIEPGEFLVLVGRSGCGKSTCLRMVAGLEEASSGEIRIGGRRVNELPPKERDVGMVFQSYALYPHMTVRENIAFGLKLRKLPAADIATRVDEVAKMLELDGLLARFPRELSGGQRQRVAMGRAIARRPRVFLFDEPLSNLDAALRVQMRSELAGLHRRLGATMVYVTHDQVEAMTLATRIAVLEAGVLQQVDRPLELFHKPANRFVAGFIGSPAMNLIDGTVSVEGGAASFRSSTGSLRCALRSAPAGVAAGEKVTLGVRPNDVSAAKDVPGLVEAVEPMGWEAYAHIRHDAGKLVVRLEGAAAGVRVGEAIHFGIDPARVHLFAADGRAVLHPA